MSTFEGSVLKQTVAVANQHKIEPRALLAVVEIESAGKSMENDGKTPCLLFERHIFYRELKKAGKYPQLNTAVALGLAHPDWRAPGTPNSQYRDQGSSSGRLALFVKAKAVDEECAIRSCSWGVGQTMGFLAEELHFANARLMLAYMSAGGVPAQVECMVREIENKNQKENLNRHLWAQFARVYNGPGYAKNNYDHRMAQSYSKWTQIKLPDTSTPDPIPVPPPPPPDHPQPKPTPKHAGILAGIVAFFAGMWAAMKQLPWQDVAFLALMVVIVVVTVSVLWYRHRHQPPQLGTLAAIDTGAA